MKDCPELAYWMTVRQYRNVRPCMCVLIYNSVYNRSVFDIQRIVHRDIFLQIKAKEMRYFSNIFW